MPNIILNGDKWKYKHGIMNNYCNASMHIKRSEIPFQTGDNSEMLFDYEYDGIVFDMKTHGVNDNVMILNDMNAIDACIVKQGSLFLFVITEQYAMDDDGSFKIWHDKLKGKPSKYVSSNKNRRTRMRKKSAIIERMDLFEINYHNASMLKIMKQPHNSNGKPRPMKYMLDDRLIQPVSSINLVIYSFAFSMMVNGMHPLRSIHVRSHQAIIVCSIPVFHSGSISHSHCSYRRSV